MTASEASNTAKARGKGDPLRLVVLLSGGGRTLQNLAQKVELGEIPAVIAGVISSRPDAYGIERARKLGLPHQTIDSTAFPKNCAFSRALTDAVDAYEPDLVVLAGFIRKWIFPARYQERVVNIHPALLPAFGGKGFYGSRVHRAVVETGVKFSGCTVHFADLDYDTGPIILQRVIPIEPNDTADTLADRVFKEECIAYPEAIRLFAEGRIEVQNGRVVIGGLAAGRSQNGLLK